MPMPKLYIQKTCLMLCMLCAHFCSFAQTEHPSQPTYPDPVLREKWEQEHAAHFERMLNNMANRLEIKASQEAQWDSFTKALRAFNTHKDWNNELENGASSKNEGIDAALIAKKMADKMTDRAQKMTVLANETARLQKVLTNDQQKILNQMAWRFVHRSKMHSSEHPDWHSGNQVHPDRYAPMAEPTKHW
jgi:LTXXQ motif family protein